MIPPVIKATLRHIATGRDCLMTSEAAQQSGYSTMYLSHLVREGKLDGFQLDSFWLIYADSLEAFLSVPHKSGPKGPIGKRKEMHP